MEMNMAVNRHLVWLHSWRGFSPPILLNPDEGHKKQLHEPCFYSICVYQIPIGKTMAQLDYFLHNALDHFKWSTFCLENTVYIWKWVSPEGLHPSTRNSLPVASLLAWAGQISNSFLQRSLIFALWICVMCLLYILSPEGFLLREEVIRTEGWEARRPQGQKLCVTSLQGFIPPSRPGQALWNSD